MEQDKQQDKQQMENQKPERKPDEHSGVHVQGHIKIFDPVTGEEFVNKRNAIHYENISVALAQNLSNKSQSFIYEKIGRAHV